MALVTYARQAGRAGSSFWLALFALVLGSPALAAEASADDPAVWAQDGRPLPEPEFLQPTLDDRLPPYRPCPANAIRGKLEGSAPAILPKLVDKWLQAFQALYPNARIAVPPPYLGPQGSLSPPMQKFLDGRSDFAFVSRDLAASDLASFRKAHGYDALSIPVVAGAYRHFGFVDAVTVIVNAKNPIEHLDFTQLDAIFSKSRLRGHAPARTWGDIGVAQWSDKPIHVVGASAWNHEESARAITIRDKVLSVGGKPGQWRDDLPSRGSEAEVPEQVAADPYAIGFTGMGHLVKGTKTVALSDGSDASFYGPTYEDIARAKYPLARVAYIAVARQPGRPIDPTLREFTRFILSREGQRIVLDQGILLPLRASQVADALRLLDANDTPNGCDLTPGSVK